MSLQWWPKSRKHPFFVLLKTVGSTPPLPLVGSIAAEGVLLCYSVVLMLCGETNIQAMIFIMEKTLEHIFVDKRCVYYVDGAASPYYIYALMRQSCRG